MAESFFEWVKRHCSCYPEVLGFNYLADVWESNPPKVDLEKLNEHEFVFVHSDFGFPIPDCYAIQFLTGSDSPGSWMWVAVNCDYFDQMPASEYTETPVVGFVGRCPIFRGPDGTGKLHRGFEPRYNALVKLMQSEDICVDFHIRSEPTGESCGFWDKTLPDFRKNEPLFKTNMLACQYQVCARGNGNYSQRLFETLAYGRIPVFIDSQSKWPLYQGTTKDFEEVIGGFPFPVIYDVDDIEKEILEFHSQFDNQHELTECQNECRDFFDKWFSQEAQIREFKYYFEEYWKRDE